MRAQPMSSRPWWACLWVLAYLLAAHGVVVVLLGLNSNWLSGLYMSIYVLPLFVVAAPVAWLILALTHRRPWLKPQVDALIAVVFGLTIAAILLSIAVLRPGNTLAGGTGASLADLMAQMGHGSTRAELIYQHATTQRDKSIADVLSASIAE